MTSSPSPLIVDEAEALVRRLADVIARPRPGECIACYMGRNVAEFGCNGTHRFALRYRDAVAPRATALLDRLSALGGCCCDCELFANGLWLRGAASDDDTGGPFRDEAPDPSPDVALVPASGCAGVRRGSTRWCVAWSR